MLPNFVVNRILIIEKHLIKLVLFSWRCVYFYPRPCSLFAPETGLWCAAQCSCDGGRACITSKAKVRTLGADTGRSVNVVRMHHGCSPRAPTSHRGSAPHRPVTELPGDTGGEISTLGEEWEHGDCAETEAQSVASWHVRRTSSVTRVTWE